MMGDRPLRKIVGYWRETEARHWPWPQWLVRKIVYRWRETEARHWPQPQWLVRPGWRMEDRARIVNYLRSGHEFASWLGFSFCRFNCGIDDRLLGCSDLTDGEWVWPEGLAHYVEAHSVCLPEAFVQAMCERRWQVPKEVAPPPADLATDASVWEQWTRQHQRKPWYAFW